MAERRIVRTPAAENDLIDIWVHVAAESPSAADRLLDLLDRRIRQLAAFPESGRLRPEIASDARGLTIGRYVVLYRMTPTGTVEVVRIVHGARHWATLF
jgi:toxin ParE1/3/4